MPKSTTSKSLFLSHEFPFARLSRIAGLAHLAKSQDVLDGIAREIIEIARQTCLSRQQELCQKASELLLSPPGLLGAARGWNVL
jgi:hypothetical protein